MFQTFTLSANGKRGPERLARLREAMKDHGVSVFLVPHADEYQNEYLPERAERLAWLTGFTGSAGFAIATHDTCVVFVDGRYTLQARDQIDPSAFSLESLTELPPSKWLEQNCSKGDVIGYDPWLTTHAELATYSKRVSKSGAILKQVPNLIDAIWTDQPDAPMAPVSIHPETYACKSAAEKLEEIQAVLRTKKADFTVLTDPASLAWLFNIRGQDVVHNPLPLGFALIHADAQPVIFMAERKLTEPVKDYLSKISAVKDPAELETTLESASENKTVLIDTRRVPVALTAIIESHSGTIKEDRDPVILPRAIKNKTEIEGARAAHIRDGVAMCKFLHWLDAQPTGSVTEIDAAKALERFRVDNAIAMGSELKEISFDTISGSGPNGAIVHYRVTEESNRTLGDGELFLCDSGGQYADGTTDITRTVAIGNPPAEAVRDFTLVLKGNLAIATARFPKGTRGIDLDPLARSALWQDGKDFAHGTGHGVGSYLNVHEGPQSISKRGMEPLLPGMLISNEPGFYREGSYGIRIENLVFVKDAEKGAGSTIETHSFETITLCPIDRRLIDATLLTPFERETLNAYHADVWDKLSEHLNSEEREWLKSATAAI